MSEKMVPDPGRQAALEEMQGVWARQYESLAILKENAKTILSYTSLFLGLIGILQISNFFSSPSIVYKWLASAAAIGYIVLVWLTLTILGPAKVQGPIDSDRGVLEEYFYDKTGDELVEQRIASYLGAIRKNDVVIMKRAVMLTWASRLFATIIFLLFLMGIFA